MMKPGTVCEVVGFVFDCRHLNGRIVTVSGPPFAAIDFAGEFLSFPIEPELPYSFGTNVTGMGANHLRPISDPDCLPGVNVDNDVPAHA